METPREKLQRLRLYSNPSQVLRTGRQMGYNISVSPRPAKKYMIVTPTGKMVDFGQMGYADYTKHKDPKRRQRFLSRNHKWKDADPYSAAYLSYHLLW